MKALTILPGIANSLNLKEVAEPALDQGNLLCEMVMVGVCGTDFEIAGGLYGRAPISCDHLILGHESLGRVLETGPNSKFQPGDLVVGFVRTPDPLPCVNCAQDEWDMCRNGHYKEHGIKELQGFASERFRLHDACAMKIDPSLESVGVLLEPASIVAKAWEQIQRIGTRSVVAPKVVLVTGAGPLGLLTALMGKQLGLDIHVFDLVNDGPKPDLVHALGATYHYDFEEMLSRNIAFDITIECTGSTELIYRLINQVRADGILCLTGVSSVGVLFPTDIGALNLNLVLQNAVIFGTVNANRRHYELARESLMSADNQWLERLITRKVALSDWQEAFTRQRTDIKVVLTAGN